MRKTGLVLLCSLAMSVTSPPDTMCPVIPGMQAINATQLMSNELSLNDWYDYLYFMAGEADSLGLDAFYKALPDTNARNVKYLYQDKWFKIFMTDVKNQVYPALSQKDMHAYLYNADHFEWLEHANVPLTGISYEQANDYCRWRSSMEQKLVTRTQRVKGSAPLSFRFTYRLPTPSEWTIAALKGIQSTKYPDTEQKYRAGKNEKNCMLLLFNYHPDTTMCEYFKDHISKYNRCNMVDVNAFNPNYLSLYNMMGNAAEMSSEKGIAMGGSYLQPISECQPESSTRYATSAEWLGLRLIADLQVLSK